MEKKQKLLSDDGISLMLNYLLIEGRESHVPFGMQLANHNFFLKITDSHQNTVATTSKKFIFICKVNDGNGKQCSDTFYQTNCSKRSKGTPCARDRLKLIFQEGPKGGRRRQFAVYSYRQKGPFAKIKVFFFTYM